MSSVPCDVEVIESLTLADVNCERLAWSGSLTISRNLATVDNEGTNLTDTSAHPIRLCDTSTSYRTAVGTAPHSSRIPSPNSRSISDTNAIQTPGFNFYGS